MDKSEAQEKNLLAEHEVKKEEDDSEGLDQSGSTGNASETITSENQTSSPRSSSFDVTGGGESVSDNVFRDDEDQKDYSVEDESYEESSQQEKEQDSNVQKAVPQASENVAQPSPDQSSSTKYNYPPAPRSSPLESISEDPELAMLPPKKRALTGKLRKQKNPPKRPSRTNVSLAQANKETAQKNKQLGAFEKSPSVFPKIKDMAQMLPVLMRQNVLQAEPVPAACTKPVAAASTKLTAFPVVPMKEKDEPHNRQISNLIKKLRPKAKIEQPSSISSRLTKRSVDFLAIPMQENTGQVESTAGESKILKRVDESQRKDPRLVSQSSREEKTALVESKVSEKLEKPSLILPPKKDRRFMATDLTEEQIATIVSLVDDSNELRRLSQEVPQDENLNQSFQILMEDNVAHVASPAIPFYHDKDSELQLQSHTTELVSVSFDELLNAIKPYLKTAEDVQDSAPAKSVPDTSETEQSPSVLSPTKDLSHKSPVSINEESERNESEHEVSKELEKSLPDNSSNEAPSNLPDTSEMENKPAQDMQPSEASEQSEETPYIFPRTKFKIGQTCKTVPVNMNLAQVVKMWRKFGMNENTRSDEEIEEQPNLTEQTPAITPKFPPGIPLLLDKNIAKTESIVSALKQVGHAPSTSTRPQNISYVPLVPTEENAAQDDLILDDSILDDTILDKPEKLTKFPSVPMTEKDIPYNICWRLPVGKSHTRTSASKAPKKIKRIPPAVLKINNGSSVSQAPSEEAAAQPVPEPLEVSAPAASVSFESAELTKFPSVPMTEKDLPHNIRWKFPVGKSHTRTSASKAPKKVERIPPAVLKINNGSSISQAPSEEAAPQPVPEPLEVSAPAASISFESAEHSSPQKLKDTAHIPPTRTKSKSKTAQSQLKPKKPRKISSDLTSPTAEDEWLDFKISDEKVDEGQSPKIEKSEATERLKTNVPSDVSTISRQTRNIFDKHMSNVMFFNGAPTLTETSITSTIAFSPASQYVPPNPESFSFAKITHDEYLQALSQNKIKIFIALRENIPKEEYIRDLIGVQVYRWVSCTEQQQPCDQYCSECEFCCHEFYCTCKAPQFRAVSWCMHIHAAIHQGENKEDEVTFVMDTWQMCQPQLAHLRATCYDLDNVIYSKKYNSFLVKTFGLLRAKVTCGNMKQRCNYCDPKFSCSTCDICPHVYQCICQEFRRGELCEHCHVVGLFRKNSEDLGPISGTKQTSTSSGISEQAFNSGGTSTQASGSGTQVSLFNLKSGGVDSDEFSDRKPNLNDSDSGDGEGCTVNVGVTADQT
ncbi:hypothetical protein V9T40_005074 [Parthenolecanium corni]|uniref:Uncharacterized protein n=1 Tax=Parthenolecanium corni TaxID=536013 RepID=A0AAN9TF44_9HEMI